MRLRAHGPSTQRFRLSARAHAGKPGLIALPRAHMRFAVRIGKVQDVMHDSARRRLHIDSRDPSILREAKRHRFPSGIPCFTHSPNNESCSALSRRSSRNGYELASAFHGGIRRDAVTAAICRPCFETSANESNEKGAASPGR
jgi:hypothetical protein